MTGPPLPRPRWPLRRGDGVRPPHTADTGLASYILRNFDGGAWRSHAEGRWLAAATRGEQLVRPGSVIAVTEGARVVAYFTVHHAAGS